MGKKKKIRMKIVATTSLPAVDRPNADCWNAARSRQFNKEDARRRFCPTPLNRVKRLILTKL